MNYFNTHIPYVRRLETHMRHLGPITPNRLTSLTNIGRVFELKSSVTLRDLIKSNSGLSKMT